MYSTTIRLAVCLACALLAPLASSFGAEVDASDSNLLGTELGIADKLGSTVEDPSVVATNFCEACEADAQCSCCDCGCYQTKWHQVTKCEPVWQPLHLCCNLTDAWFEPFVGGPNGSSGAPRQGWLATPDGFFTKEFHVFYGRLNNLNGSTDVDTALFQFQYPLTRRLWVGLDVPYSDYGDHNRGFDDTVVTGKALLHETQDFGLTAELGVRAPTGDEELGGGLTALIPAVNTWSDIGGGWSLRSGVGVALGTGGVPNNASDSDMLYTVALGQTITPHDAPLGDFTYYTAINGRSQLDGEGQHTFLYVTPGMRTHLFCNLFFLTAVQIPVTGPDSYDSNLMFMFVKGL